MILETMIQTGLRPGEVCSLQKRDVAVRYGKRQVYVRHGKWSRPRKGQIKDKSRWVTITRSLADLLGAYLDRARNGAGRTYPVSLNRWSRPLRYRNLYDMIKSVGRRAGLEDLRPHRLRHTYSTFFLNSGGGLKALQEQLGHEHYRTTEIYAKSLESAKEAAVDDFENYLEEQTIYIEA